MIRAMHVCTIACLLGLLLPAAKGLAAAGNAIYSYDSLGRLTDVTYEDGTIQSYSYDDAGNRQQTRAKAVGGLLRFVDAGPIVDESAATLTLLVSRSESSVGPIAVLYSMVSGSANAGSDFTAASGSLSWADNDVAAKAIVVTVLNDTTNESLESFQVVLSSPGGGAAIEAGTAAVSIIDDETVAFHTASLATSEGVPGGVSKITVTRSGSTSATHSVSYATRDGTATTATGDYASASGMLTFSGGDTSKTIDIRLANDGLAEGEEAFTLYLSSPTNGAVIHRGTATITILDAQAQPSFGVTNTSVSESASSVAFTVTRTGETDSTQRVRFATVSGGATAGLDFTAQSGELTFGAHETSKVVTVALLGDSIYEGEESFALNLSNPGGGAIIGRASARATITEDDPLPAPGTVRFSTATFAAPETAASAAVSVVRSGGAAGPASVVCSTSDGSALAGADYTSISKTLDWDDGEEGAKTCGIPLINDTTFEEVESINVSLGDAVGATLGSPDSAVVSLSSEEPPPVGILSLSNNSISVSENAGSVTFRVSRVNGAYGAAQATCSLINGSAVGGTDYGASPIALSWSHNDDTDRVCTIPIHDDSVYGGNKTFTLALTGVSGAVVGTPAATTVTIAENDPAPVFSISDATLGENGGTMYFTVSKSAPTELAHTVTYWTTDATANSLAGINPDFAPANTSIAIGPSESSKQIGITIHESTVARWEGPSESFTVSLGTASGGGSIGRSTATGTIIETDGAPSLRVTSNDIVEGGTLQLGVVLGIGITEVPISAAYSTYNGTAAAGSDYQAVAGTLTIPPGSTGAAINIPTYDDPAVESQFETVYVQLSNPTNGATISPAQGNGVIADNDNVFPSTPLNLRTNPPGSYGNYSAAWDPSSGAVAYYQLERDIDTAFVAPNYNLYTVNHPTTSKAFTVGTATRTFYFRVRACNASNQCSAWSSVVSRIVDGTGGGGGDR